VSIIKIRFNNDCTDGVSFWRAIIDGVEHHLSEIVINTNSRTTKDYLESKNEYKWHLTVESYNYKIHNGKLTIN